MKDEAARKERHREYMRQRLSGPVLRAAHNAKTLEYKRKNWAKHIEYMRDYRTKRRAEDPEFRASEAKQSRENYARLRTRLFAAYGNVCACCGENEPSFLELDHVNGGGAKHFRSHTTPVGVYREVLAAGCPSEYRLLCSNCNRGRQRNNGLCPHYVKDLAFIDVLAENFGRVNDAR